MGLRLWDYQCPCGKEYRDWPVDGERVPQTIKCECGKRAGWATMRPNYIHRSLSTLYGKKDPRTGETYESYEEKQADFRRRGLTEGDIEHPDDIAQDVAEQEAKSKERDPNTLVADSLEEIQQKINNQAIDRRHTGNLTGRAGQDPKTGLIDSWGGF